VAGVGTTSTPSQPKTNTADAPAHLSPRLLFKKKRKSTHTHTKHKKKNKTHKHKKNKKNTSTKHIKQAAAHHNCA
jgi:hypothetical protein